MFKLNYIIEDVNLSKHAQASDHRLNTVTADRRVPDCASLIGKSTQMVLVKV